MEVITKQDNEAVHVELQNRDLDVLEGLFEMRLLTLPHAAAIFFDERREAAKKRLQKLKVAGLLGERARRVYERSILFLTRKAFDLLSAEGRLTKYPNLTWSSFERRARVSNSTLQHELAVLDVKAALTLALRKEARYELAQFLTWPLLFEFVSRPRAGEPEILVRPDGYVSIHERDRDNGGACYSHSFFLELDRSTETQETLARKAACYRTYYRSGSFAAHHGYSQAEECPFLVLVVCQNAERRNNAAERLLQLSPPVLQQVWFTTFKEVTTNPLDHIWMRPIDYYKVTEGTRFDPERRRGMTIYRRDPEREEFVAKLVQKQALLTLGDGNANTPVGPVRREALLR